MTFTLIDRYYAGLYHTLARCPVGHVVEVVHEKPWMPEIICPRCRRDWSARWSAANG